MAHRSLACPSLVGAAAWLLGAVGGPTVAQELVSVIDERFDPPGEAAGLPDPFLFRDGEDWFIFGTGRRCARTRLFTPEEVQLYDLELDLGQEAARGAYQVWSLRVYRHTDGAYHAYGTLHYGWFRTAVAHFVPQPDQVWAPGRPITRWRLDRVLVGDLEAGHYAYDSNVVRDEDGTLYLIYNAGYPVPDLAGDVHILAWRMRDPATPDPEFVPRPILSPEGFRSEDRNPGHKQLVEGTHLQRLQGKCVLLYSVGDFDDSNYKLGVAFSDTLIPPPGETYRKVTVPDPGKVWGSEGREDEVLYLLQTQVPEWPHYCGHLVNGPGIGSIVALPDGQTALVFHARRPGVRHLGGQGRYVWRLPVRVAIADGAPLSTWIEPLIPPPP